MNPAEFLKAIGSVNSIWSIAAFTIAAVMALMNLYLRKMPDSKAKGRKPPAFGGGLLWAGVGVICLMGLAPIAANGFLESQRLKTSSVYHIRVVVLNSDNVPISGARLRASVSNEVTTTAGGEIALTIARGNLPADGKVTLFADDDSAFLHGSQEIQLAGDANPSVSIHLKQLASAGISGIVEDREGRAVEGALVSVPGHGSVRTSATGSFSLDAFASPGQTVTLHVEKAGFEAVDQSHLAGGDPAAIVLNQSVAQATGRAANLR